MGDKHTGEPLLGLEADGFTDYEGVLPSDTVSLSDSDSDDLTFADNAEAAPEEPCSLENVGSKSDGNGEQKPNVQPFHLKGMSSSFSQRSQSIFDCLEGAAKQAVPSAVNDNITDGRFKRPLPPPTLSNKMSGESQGRQNKPPPSLKRPPSVPDYVTHPERWTKYSLEDVPESSDKTNRSVAMEFLEGLKKSKEKQNESYTPSFNQDASSSGAGRIIFSKPTKALLHRPEKKKQLAKEEEETEEDGTDQELIGKFPDKPDGAGEEENTSLDPLKSSAKEQEDRDQLESEKPDVKKRSATDSSEALEEKEVVTVGFHGSKKRSRKQFRPKASHDEDEEES